MPAWKATRFFALAVVLGWMSGARVEAAPFSSSSGTWNWWFAGEWRGSVSSSSSPAPINNPTVTHSAPVVASEPIFTPIIASQPATSPIPVSTISNAAAPVTFSSASAASVGSTAPTYDGFVNLGSGPYGGASSIASGSPQPWYDSAGVAKLFGGQPTAQQQADFSNTVLQRVEQTFQLSSVPVSLTTDPNASAAHSLSVVSNSSSIPFPNSIGTSLVGGNGFNFIDQIAKSVQSVDQLEWVVAHNVSHELMLTFGVPEKYDQTGNYIDATNANWSMITSPTATFSTDAATALNQALQSQHVNGGSSTSAQNLAQNIEPQPVPEPAAILLWGGSALALLIHLRRKTRCAA